MGDHLLLVMLDQLIALQARNEPLNLYAVGRVHDSIVGRAEDAVWLNANILHPVLCAKDFVEKAENLCMLALRKDGEKTIKPRGCKSSADAACRSTRKRADKET